jgi:subtilisin family serine protease
VESTKWVVQRCRQRGPNRPQLVGLAASIALLLLCSAGGVAANGQSSSGLRGYIVVLRDSVEHPGAVAEAQTERRDGDLDVVYRHALNGYAATLPTDRISSLRDDPRVAFVTRDHEASVLEEEVELETEENGGVEVLETTIPTGINRIFAPGNKALDIDGNDDLRADVDVAVLDTGIDYEHPDLAVVARTSCVTGTCIDNTGNDGHSHGTHVAGTIGAIDNGEGVVGVASGARMWAVKVLSDAGSGSESWIIAGVDWVTAHASEIEVANMSLGCSCPMPALDTAINGSVEAGVVYAVAAGNSNANVSSFSPASNPNVISVSAIADYDGLPGEKSSYTCQNYGLDDEKASFSNYGAGSEITAPGVCILSTIPGNKYGYKSGTSMASPHVAGAAAVLATISNPGSKKDVETIRETLIKAGNTGWLDNSGDGVLEPLLDVSNEATFALTRAPKVSTEIATSIKAKEATLNGAINPGGLSTSYRFEYGKTTSYGTSVPVPNENVGSGTKTIGKSKTISGLEESTTYHFRIMAENSQGTSYGADRTFTTKGPPPTVVTGSATGVTATEAILHGTVNPNGFSTTDQFEYGTTTSYGITVPAVAESAGSGVVAVEKGYVLTGLLPSTTYHFRITGTSGEGTSLGKDATFTTSSLTPTFSSNFGSSGSGNSQFAEPTGIAVNPLNGNLVVPDEDNHRVQVFNEKGEFVTKFGSFGTGNGQFNTPRGAAVDLKSNIWIIDTGNNRVEKFNEKGEYLSQFGTKGTGNGQFTTPKNLAVDSKGNIWVADSGNNRVEKFNEKGEYVCQFSAGTNPVGVFADAKGNIWSDNENETGAIEEHNESCGFVTSFVKRGSETGQIREPKRLAVDANGYIWVPDAFNHRVQVFNEKGEFVTKFGSFGSGSEQMNYPSGVAVDLRGNVWVDDNNNRVDRWIR